MPYIKQEMREKLDPSVNELMHALDYACTNFSGPGVVMDYDKLDGVLNYTFTKILKHFYTDGVDAGGIPLSNYARLNRAVGLVNCVGTEFERRVVAPYEDTKIYENGDVQ
jgi:hypothetical protein